MAVAVLRSCGREAERADVLAMQCLKPTRVRDKAYQRRAQHMNCAVPECYDTETVVLAHINIAGNFGRALKAGDDESLYLCRKHHDEFDDRLASSTGARCEWIVRNIVLPRRKQAYTAWKMGVGQ